MSSQGSSQYRLDSRYSMTVSQRRDTVSDCGVRERLSKGDPLRTKHQSSVELVERRWIRQFWMRGEILRRPLHRRWHCSRLVQAAEQASVLRSATATTSSGGPKAELVTRSAFRRCTRSAHKSAPPFRAASRRSGVCCAQTVALLPPLTQTSSPGPLGDAPIKVQRDRKKLAKGHIARIAISRQPFCNKI